MRKLFSLLSASAMVLAVLCSSAQAWDNCGYGMHRNVWGRCHSNYGPNSGCQPGYHVGLYVYKCVPNGTP
jgi:hypothetical protein